ncbi:hypothetical protein M406DRAFT_290418 [Cryphonectria parasitica EP155]|uniref:Hydroxyproline-rich glyco protein n=1 Tax=Cryphonectria parasitica (strain ATCC 38755 / EP155) TaxID=660469 RepID=A0A9P4Y329_CRYP1|nr:uncharacterized protein M406DRAFT_290418 [Cryphonectria parasitica EP155]KAF3766072.1 hypothetical protein M406DRAFT_290418 [Cryphonectria parasitica EP155]
MDDSPEPSQNDDPSNSPEPVLLALPEVITIDPRGDILLDVTFETSRSTLKAARKATPKPRPGQRDPPPPLPVLKPHIRLAYRVDLATLKKHSRYFTNLLGDTRFQEARAIAQRLDEIAARGQNPGDLAPEDLPRVEIEDDDEATRTAGRETAFADMLRVLHGLPTVTKPVTVLYVTTLAVLADRFACTAPVSRHLIAVLKFRWPTTPPLRPREDGLSGLTLAAEELVRQKVLVAWLLEQAPRLAAATKELVLFGSHRWSVAYEDDEDDGGADAGRGAAHARQDAVWWFLPDGLEEELHYRRHQILRSLASIPAHFLHLYTTRTRNGYRQCKLGYDSSSACDSFQLGEMVRFLVSKNLLFLTNFAPSSLDEVKDFAAVDVGSILGALKQCPNYQVDRHHTNCGLRTRVMPILEYVAAMLGTTAAQIGLQGWKRERRTTSWQKPDDHNDDNAARGASRKKDFVVEDSMGDGGGGGGRGTNGGRVFYFTRSVASDQRLRFEGAMAADRLARELFTADAWDWTPEDVDRVDQISESKHLSMPLRRKERK